MINYSTWKLLVEADIRTWLQEVQARFTDLGTIMAMADNLGEEGDESTSELLRLSLDLSSPNQRQDNGEILDRYHHLKNQMSDELRKIGIYISEHNNEVYVTDQKSDRPYARARRYFFNGSNIRLQTPIEGYKYINLRDVTDENIIKAFVVILAEKILETSFRDHGLVLPRVKNGKYKYVTRKGWELSKQYASKREESLLRSYLSPFLFAFTQSEKSLSEVQRLQRNRQAIHQLQSSLRYSVDEDAVIQVINTYKEMHGKTDFLIELANRIDKFLETISEMPQLQQQVNGLPNLGIFRNVARVIAS